MGNLEGNKKLRELHGWRLYGYSLGSFGIFLPYSLANVYLFQFYVYIIGLDALIVSIGLFLASIFFGIFSIIFGVLADNKIPTRFGKRRVVFLWGILPFSLISILLWIPPWKCPENIPIYLPTAIFFCFMVVLYRIFNALLLTPYNSILPEISQSETNRIKVTGIQVLLTTISAMIAMLLPMIFQSIVEDPLNTKWWEPSGEIIIKLIPWVAIVLTVISIIILIITFVSIDEKFHFNDLVKKSAENKELISRKRSLRETFQHIFIPIKDQEYKKLVTSIGLSEMGTIITSIGFIPFLTYVAKFQEEQFLWGYAMGGIVLFIGLKIWGIILKKYGLIKGFQINFLVSMVCVLLSLVFFLPLPSWLAFGFGALLLSVIGANSMGKYLFFAPMISHMIDISPIKDENIENSKNPIKNLSGAYVGLQMFVANVTIGIANLMVGFFLSGSRAENPTIIILTYVVLGFIFLLGWIILRKMKFKNTE
jgi:Na+/melibiose symporter-like transporter